MAGMCKNGVETLPAVEHQFGCEVVALQIITYCLHRMISFIISSFCAFFQSVRIEASGFAFYYITKRGVITIVTYDMGVRLGVQVDSFCCSALADRFLEQIGYFIVGVHVPRFFL